MDAPVCQALSWWWREGEDCTRTSGLLRGHGPLSLMGSAGRRLDRLHALWVPRPARDVPTTVLPVMPSLRDRLSNRWCDPFVSEVVETGRPDYAAAAM
jgi:hypothetical protein